MTFTVTAVQPSIQLPYPTAQSFEPEAIEANIDRAVRHIEIARSEQGSDLVVFPEFFLTGYTLGVDVAGWIKASISFPGPQIDRLSKAAIAHGVYVAGAAYEVMPEFPGRFFNTAFLIAPSGEVVLKYRKLYAMTTKTRPGDVLDEWLQRFGAASLFPVADTPMGRIGALIARDAHWPEMARCLALRGAEILLTHNAAGAEPENGGLFARRSRAYENHCYLVCANIGPFVVDGVEECGSGRAPSEIIDYHGNVLAAEARPAELTVSAELDIEALRAFRTGGNPKGNFLAQLQPQLHVPFYQEANLFPTGGWKDNPIQDTSENANLEAAVVKRMIEDHVLIPPGLVDN